MPPFSPSLSASTGSLRSGAAKGPRTPWTTSSEWRQPLLVWEQLSIGTSRVAHRSELDELEKLTVSAWPFLAEQHRATELRPNETSDNQSDRREHDQGEHRESEVERTLSDSPVEGHRRSLSYSLRRVCVALSRIFAVPASRFRSMGGP
jgi:hypothetical protein